MIVLCLFINKDLTLEIATERKRVINGLSEFVNSTVLTPPWGVINLPIISHIRIMLGSIFTAQRVFLGSKNLFSFYSSFLIVSFQTSNLSTSNKGIRICFNESNTKSKLRLY